jgi:hypothetical protein
MQTEKEWMDAAKDLYPDLFKEGKARGGSVASLTTLSRCV